MDIIIASIYGMFFNRIRGMDIPFHTEFNFVYFGFIIALLNEMPLYYVPALSLAMWLGSATGWTEGVKGCFNQFEMSGHQDRNWISKIVTPKDQLTTFLYMCIRSVIWVLPIFALLQSPLILLAVPGFYCSYRIANYIPYKDRWALGEVIFGGLLWGLCVI